MNNWTIRRIDSTGNDTLKRLAKLMGSVANMKQAGIAVAEGLHLVQGLIGQKRFVLDSVFVPDELANQPEWLGLEALLRKQSREIADHPEVIHYSLPMVLYKKISKLNTPTGPMVIFTLPEPRFSINLDHDVVLLDDVQDPGNVGTLLRNCAAAGVQQIVCTQGTAWVWGDKVLRAGMCAQFGLEFFTEAELLKALEKRPAAVIRVTSLERKSTDLFNTDLRQAGVWVFGSEGQGVGATWLGKATQHLTIPQSNLVDSLNVASSSAVCLFEQFRQRRSI